MLTTQRLSRPRRSRARLIQARWLKRRGFKSWRGRVTDDLRIDALVPWRGADRSEWHGSERSHRAGPARADSAQAGYSRLVCHPWTGASSHVAHRDRRGSGAGPWAGSRLGNAGHRNLPEPSSTLSRTAWHGRPPRGPGPKAGQRLGAPRVRTEARARRRSSPRGPGPHAVSRVIYPDFSLVFTGISPGENPRCHPAPVRNRTLDRSRAGLGYRDGSP